MATPRVLSNRRARESELIAATRALFDERGLQDAPIEEIARAVGINKALIYRYYASKEELFVATLRSYLGELAERLATVDAELDPLAQLEQGWRRYTDYCLEHPAFVDCSVSLMRRPARELRDSVSDGIWFRLGQSMAVCLGALARILRAGAQAGVFAVEDPDFTANHLYAQTLGTMHLARVGIGVREAAPGVPLTFPIDPARVQSACIADALASVRAR